VVSDPSTGDPRQALFSAVAAGDAAGVRRILAADPTLANARNDAGDSPLLVALYNGRADIVALLKSEGAEVNLFEACALGDLEIARAHLARDPALVGAYSHDGWTALHLAAFFGHRDLVGVLIDRGADIDARSRSARFAQENTPLHAAAANRQTAAAEVLIDRGADINARDGRGFTPLGLAAGSRNDLLVIRLLGLGAQVS
jgi:uncharacterized protein